MDQWPIELGRHFIDHMLSYLMEQFEELYTQFYETEDLYGTHHHHALQTFLEKATLVETKASGIRKIVSGGQSFTIDTDSSIANPSGKFVDCIVDVISRLYQGWGLPVGNTVAGY